MGHAPAELISFFAIMFLCLSKVQYQNKTMRALYTYLLTAVRVLKSLQLMLLSKPPPLRTKHRATAFFTL
ncbi:hypothetical protein EI77_02067 [Prosthecobacter fusiformis]|uniref:Uncharacterized protein n=1 Tax=Prosthecobacter fusiformis TaxID=48464 RepID=A0A4R7RZV6_9BACT|nr:hypothetical protein EI77_02067 [Prosthecobacter fusiformis]